MVCAATAAQCSRESGDLGRISLSTLVGFLIFVVNFATHLALVTFFAMRSGSGLQRYFPRLADGDGSGSSFEAGAGPLLGNSSNDLEAKLCALHSVCPTVKKRKLQHRKGFATINTRNQPCSNPTMMLLSPANDVAGAEIGGSGADASKEGGDADVIIEGGDGGVITEGGAVHVSAAQATIILDCNEDNNEQDDDDFSVEPVVKVAKRSYDKSRKFQLTWVARCPWAEAVERSGVTMVRCTTCELATGKPTILALKIATLQRYEGNYTAEKNMPGGVKKGDKYIATNCRHLKNERVVAKRGMRPIQEAIQDVVGERARKRQQMGVIFHLLSSGRPMVDYGTSRSMLQFLGVPKLAKRHWNDVAGWILAECMFRQVEAKSLEMVKSARFISISCNEVTSIDNGSWISIHAYVVQN
jgi:hypothetical protein